MKFYIGFWVLIFVIIGCTDPTKTNIAEKKDLPRNLNEAIIYLQKKLPPAELNGFKNQNEANAVSHLHFSVGLWIRNNWIHDSRDTVLVQYFNSIGSFHSPDDISSIILTSLHRKLNNKNIDLKKQVEECEALWKPILECEDRTKKMAVAQYNSHALNSTITILMAVDTSYKQRNAITYECPKTEWNFNPKKDLRIRGTIKEKYFINDSSNVFFKVKIDALNHPNTTIFMDTVKIGSVVNLPLANLKIL